MWVFVITVLIPVVIDKCDIPFFLDSMASVLMFILLLVAREYWPWMCRSALNSIDCGCK